MLEYHLENFDQIQDRSGELAQLVERCDRTAEVRGSTPLFSINWKPLRADL